MVTKQVRLQGLERRETHHPSFIARLDKEINVGHADPKLKAQLAALGGTVLAGLPSEFRTLVADETEKWGKVIRDADITLN